MARGKFDPNRNEPTPAFPNGRRILSKEEEAHELTPLQDIAQEVKVVPKAPDGGYGWIIVVASFLCNFIVDGVAYSGSQYIVAWSEAFPSASKSTVSLTVSLLNGVYLLMGPVSSALTNAFGFRIVIFSGALIACAAFIISLFATSITYLILSFGVLGGIGFGLIYSPAILCVCYYFDKKRAMAVGISVCGSGVGAFVFPPLIQMVLDEYGWQGSMLILAGLVLQVCIAGSLMRTLTVDVVEEVKIAPIGDLDRAAITGDIKGDGRIRSPSGVSTKGMDLVSSKKYSSTHGIDIQTLEGGRVQHDVRVGPYKQYSSQQDINDPLLIPGIHRSQEVAAPLERKDVHVQGSLKHLNRRESEKMEVEVFRSDSLHRRQQQAAARASPPSKSWLPPQLRQALIEMADVRIYSNKVFLIFSLASFLGMIAFYIPFAFVPDHAIREFGVDKNMSALLISGIGLSNIIGRIFWGWLADRPRMDPLLIHNCCILVVGVVLGFLPLCGDYNSLMAICIIFGFFVSPFISLLSIILTSRIGLEQLPSAFGQSQLVRGIASMVGAPIGGALYESTKNYSVTFWSSAAAFVAASIIASLILVMSSIARKRRSSERMRENVVA